MKNYFQLKNFLFFGLLILAVGGFYFNSTPTKVEAGCWSCDADGHCETRWPTSTSSPVYYNGVQSGVCRTSGCTVSSYQTFCHCFPGYHPEGSEEDGTFACIPPEGMSGAFPTPPDPSTCIIPRGGNSCSQTLTWYTINPEATSRVTNSNGATPNPGPSINGSVASPASSSFSILYSTPTNPLVTFFLINNGKTLDQVRVDARCATGDNWNGSSCIATPQGSDLTADPVIPSTAIIHVSQNFSSSIRNIGNESTDPDPVPRQPLNFNVLFQVSTASNTQNPPSSTITSIGTISTSPIGAQGNRTIVSPPYTFSTAGTYSVRACADLPPYPNGVVDEGSNENNNCSAWINVAVSEPNPDLTASAPVATGPLVPGPINFKSTITNGGNVATNYRGVNSFSNKFQTSPVSDGSSGVVDYTVSPDMSNLTANGGRADISKSITLPKGTIYIRACADLPPYTSGVIDEVSNENNNCSGPWTSVTVDCPAGQGWNGSSCVTSNIYVSLSASPTEMTLPTNSTNLTWTTTYPGKVTPTRCVASDAWSGDKDVNGKPAPGELISGLSAGTTPTTYTYTITCSKTGSLDVSSSVVVTVNPVGGGVTNGACGPTPQAPKHYQCAPGAGPIDTASYKNYPSKVTWICRGTDPNPAVITDDAQCSEQKGPGFIEN